MDRDDEDETAVWEDDGTRMRKALAALRSAVPSVAEAAEWLRDESECGREARKLVRLDRQLRLIQADLERKLAAGLPPFRVFDPARDRPTVGGRLRMLTQKLGAALRGRKDDSD
jgi:hypothetical protein